MHETLLFCGVSSQSVYKEFADLECLMCMFENVVWSVTPKLKGKEIL